MDVLVPTGSGGYTYQQESGTTYVSGSEVSLLGPALEATLLKRIFLEVDAVHHSIGSPGAAFCRTGTYSARFLAQRG
jgi:hypothetical protein